MSDNFHTDTHTRTGTIGGTVGVILVNIFQYDVVRTIGLATLGATVSFFVSLGWKYLVSHSKKRLKERARRGKQGGDPAQQ
jgi:hypothetical protein